MEERRLRLSPPRPKERLSEEFDPNSELVELGAEGAAEDGFSSSSSAR